MAAILILWRQLTIALRQSMHIWVKNIPAKFHPDPIWNDRALGIFWKGRPNKNKNNNKKNKTSSDIRSLPEPRNQPQF